MSDGAEIVERLMDRVSNWGRWGADDDRGTLNHLTDHRGRAALALATAGRTVSCGRSLGPKPSEHGDPPLLHHMLSAGDEAPAHGAHINADWFGLQPHGAAMTHLDALNHVSWNGQLYNGRPVHAVTTSRGGAFGSGELASPGVLARGILLDVPAALGVDWVDPATPITPAQFEACERAAGVQVRAGDVVLVRTGRDRRAASPQLPAAERARMAGLDVECVPWLRERDVAMLCGEGMHEVVPARYPDLATPVHVLALVGAGLWLIDNLALDELAGVCRARESWQFAFVLAPIALKNSTGIPVNPLALV